MRPLRLALLGSRGYRSTYGGYETFVERLAPFLRERGHDVTVYGRGDSGERMIDGIRCVTTPGVETKSLSTLSYGATAVLAASAEHYDVVLVLNVAHGYFLPLLRRAGVPTVVNVDGVEWQRGKWGRAGRMALFHGARMTAEYADELVVDSRALAPMWHEEFGRDPHFIPYGGDGDPVAGVGELRALGLDPDGYVLLVARLVPENRVDLVLDAATAGRWPVPLVVVGSANYEAPVVERLRTLHAAGAVRWLGHVHDRALLGALWTHCTAYVHAHTVGGTNPALLQALGCGAPTVALATPFNHEVVGPEQLFPDDSDTLADLVAALLADPGRRRRLADRGREIVRSRYRWNDVCEQYEALMARVAGRTSGPQPLVEVGSD